MEVQLRTHDGDIRRVRSVYEAFVLADKTPSIEKISWDDVDGRRLRFVRDYDVEGNPRWLFDPMAPYLDAVTSAEKAPQ